MKISALSEITGVSVATLKFYLRKSVLHPGRQLSRTQAEYDDSHVARVRLIRALTEVGGLSLDTVQRVFTTMEDPQAGRIGLLATAQRALTDPQATGVPCTGSPHPGQLAPPTAQSRAHAWLLERQWMIDPSDPLVQELDRAWAACDVAGIGLDEARLDAYGDAALRIAELDLETVPEPADQAIRQVILGTVLMDPVLQALRRLAHQHVSVGKAAQNATPPR